MLSKADLENLLERESQPQHPQLSVYLDVDQSRAINLNRGFETTLKNILRAVEPLQKNKDEQKAFAANAERVLDYVSEYQPNARSLVIFADQADDLFWPRALRVPLRSEAHWGEGPYLRPLLEALTEFERYGVILTDRAHARLFTVFLGEIEEHQETFASASVRKIKTINTDHIWSEKQIQNKADQHAHSHLKQVAERMDHIANLHAFDRLVLAGPTEPVHELYRLLSKRLRARVAAAIPLPTAANERQVLEATLQVEQEIERAQETKRIEDLITAAAKNEQAVIGLEPTLDALAKKQTWQLLYVQGFSARGGQCTHCRTLFTGGFPQCAYCGAVVIPVEDLIERMGERVAEMSGRIEPVQGAAADRLNVVGGIGAFLRF